VKMPIVTCPACRGHRYTRDILGGLYQCRTCRHAGQVELSSDSEVAELDRCEWESTGVMGEHGLMVVRFRRAEEYG